MSKIVVVVRTQVKPSKYLVTDTLAEEFPDAYATNNERGELVIHKHPQSEKILAVFKDWLYWKEVT